MSRQGNGERQKLCWATLERRLAQKVVFAQGPGSDRGICQRVARRGDRHNSADAGTHVAQEHAARSMLCQRRGAHSALQSSGFANVHLDLMVFIPIGPHRAHIELPRARGGEFNY